MTSQTTGSRGHGPEATHGNTRRREAMIRPTPALRNYPLTRRNTSLPASPPRSACTRHGSERTVAQLPRPNQDLANHHDLGHVGRSVVGDRHVSHERRRCTGRDGTLERPATDTAV